MRLRAWFIAACLAFAAFGAHAQQTCYVFCFYSCGNLDNPPDLTSGRWHSTLGAAWADYSSYSPINRINVRLQAYPGSTVTFDYPDGQYEQGQKDVALGASRKEAPCNPCQTLEVRELMITRGYSNHPPGMDGIARVAQGPKGEALAGSSPPPAPGTLCIDQCMHTVGPQLDVFQSETPTPGHTYRVATSHVMTPGTAQCTATETDAAHVDGAGVNAPTACHGTKGYIQNKAVCVPQGSDLNVVRAIPIPKGTVGLGNAPAGSTPGTPTPASGDGGNKGGPAGPNDGSRMDPTGVIVTTVPSSPESGTKTSTPGEEQIACGAPGQPKCRIDESGTPTGNGALSAGETALTGAQDSAAGAINAHKQLAAPGWTWTFQLPAGCTPLVLEAFSISLNICEWQPMIHDLMSIVWAMAAVFLCLRMVFQTSKG